MDCCDEWVVVVNELLWWVSCCGEWVLVMKWVVVVVGESAILLGKQSGLTPSVVSNDV